MEHLSQILPSTFLKEQSSGPSEIQASPSKKPKPRFFGASDVVLREPDYKCKHCKDMRFVADANGRPNRCPHCANWIDASRLSPYERGRIDDIEDRPLDEDPGREALAVRFMCKEMLRDPFGFLSFAGIVGNAKSMALTALVAEFCRSGRQAVYYTAPEIVEKLVDFENKNTFIKGDIAALIERLKRISVLAIDELDKIKFSDYQIEKLGEIIDYRHRNADTQVTLFAMNRRPAEWRNADGALHIASRLVDGRFNRYWPAEHERVRPGCAVKDAHGWYIPGLLELTAADVRPRLRRDVTA